jgi:hypothetical protein
MIFKVNNKKLSNALYLQKRQNKELKEKLENVFTEDQLHAIRTKKFRKCSNETLTKSLKLKFALKLMVCRLKIYTAKLKREIRIRQKIKWSSKSHAMRDMVQNLKQ